MQVFADSGFKARGLWGVRMLVLDTRAGTVNPRSLTMNARPYPKSQRPTPRLFPECDEDPTVQSLLV